MGEMIGPYELRGELGRGAMAVVWRGFDTRLEREVAIKEPFVQSGDQASGGELAERFVREGRAAAALNHPGIVTIHAADVFDGRPAIVMELVEGQTLGSLLDGGPLSSSAALSILDQLLDAVGYAHTRGVVHRDIKPDNIFITDDGRVKLADFGIAHIGDGGNFTQAGTVMGTPGYMSPEQVTGAPVDGRSDLFSIGVIAYEMLTGSNPFGATDGVAQTTVMYRIVHEQPPALPPSALAMVPAELANALSVAMQKNPAMRFPDAASFRGALRATSAPSARGGLVRPEPPRPARPAWVPYAAAGVVAVAVMALFFAFGGGGGGGGAVVAGPQATPSATAGVPTEQIQPEVVPSEAGPSDELSADELQAFYTDIVSIGGDGGEIADLAKDFNADLGTDGASDGIISQAEDLVNRIDELAAEIEDTDVSPGFADVKSSQLELLDYCRTRAQAIADAGIASQSGSSMKSLLDEGREAKERFNDTLPSGRP